VILPLLTQHLTGLIILPLVEEVVVVILILHYQAAAAEEVLVDL
jgi:hypothetical protein